MDVGEKKKIAMLAAVVLLLHLPFINKAIHIDDTVFYYIAEQIMDTPGDPYSFSINWLGSPMTVFDFNSNPPGISYYLAAVFSIFGKGERTAHVSMVAFSLIAAFSMYYLAKKFVKYPFAAALLFLFTPICMIMAHTIMADVSMAAFYILSLTLFIYGREANDKFLLTLAGISAGLAIMFKYNGISIIPLWILSYLIYFSREKKYDILFVLIPILIFVLWNMATWKLYGGSHFLTQVHMQIYSANGNIWHSVMHLLPHLVYLGGICALFLIYTLLWDQEKLNRYIGLAIFFISGVIYIVLLKDITRYTFPNLLLVVIFLAGIIYLLVICLKSIGARLYRSRSIAKDDLFLLLWICLVLGMHNSGLHSTAKYMLPAVPPTVMLIIKYSVKLVPKKEVKILAATLGGMLCIGITAAIADYELAGIYRDMARYVEKTVSREKKASVYFTGHWGFQYYMEKKGFLAYSQGSNDLKPDDLLITCALAWPQKVNPELISRLRFVGAQTFLPGLPFRVMHNYVGEQANFYSFLTYESVYGVLPISMGKNPVEKVAVYRVIR